MSCKRIPSRAFDPFAPKGADLVAVGTLPVGASATMWNGLVITRLPDRPDRRPLLRGVRLVDSCGAPLTMDCDGLVRPLLYDGRTAAEVIEEARRGVTSDATRALLLDLVEDTTL